MTAKHFLRHLAVAYNHFHAIDEHKQFTKRVETYETQILKGEILTRLASIEARYELALGRISSDELARIKQKIKALRARL